MTVPWRLYNMLDVEYMYRSTRHWQPLLNGYSGNYPNSYIGLLYDMRVVPRYQDDRRAPAPWRDGARAARGAGIAAVVLPMPSSGWCVIRRSRSSPRIGKTDAGSRSSSFCPARRARGLIRLRSRSSVFSLQWASRATDRTIPPSPLVTPTGRCVGMRPWASAQETHADQNVQRIEHSSGPAATTGARPARVSVRGRASRGIVFDALEDRSVAGERLCDQHEVPRHNQDVVLFPD